MDYQRLLLVCLNLGLIVFFVVLVRRPGLLGFAKGGKWYATWLTIGVITLMDELTSVFYAPAEAHRFIGHQAIFFIAFTSLLMRVLSSRMVEIAQILERNNIRRARVYSFSYLVLGPVASFVAVASIMVDYILTACISTVSAVINGTTFLPIGPGGEYALILGIIWAVCGLNILGIHENARVTFGIFIGAAFVFVNLIALGILHMHHASPAVMLSSAQQVLTDVTEHSWPHTIQVVTIGVASCVLAYSGIESVIQTAGLVENWRDIASAYWFLALTVGIVTPAGAVFVTFFSPRQTIPQKVAPNHFRFPLHGAGVYRSITAVLALLQEEFNGRDVHVHLGWPLSSWLDRMATGVFVANLMRLPGTFPGLWFSIDYVPPTAHTPAGTLHGGSTIDAA